MDTIRRVSGEFIDQMVERMQEIQREAQRHQETALFQSEQDRYGIYQIRDGSKGDQYRFMGMSYLQEKGLNPRTIVIQDGSGLSRHNLLSPSFICGFLRAMEKSPEFGAFIRSLPSPGDGGTMETVMTGYDQKLKSGIRLKSGSMSGVKCFSGYIFPGPDAAKLTDTDGNIGKASGPAVFSIMINNSVMSQYRMQKIIDRIIFLIKADIGGAGK